MINLNYLNIDLDKAKKEHYDFFVCYITKKIIGKNNNKAFKFKNQKNLIRKFLFTENRLHDLILGNPKKIEEINDIFKKQVNSHFGSGTYDTYIALNSAKRSKFKPNKVHQFFTDLAKVINYKTLSNDTNYNSYTLAKNLGVRSCVYCNRTYTITKRKRNNKKGGRLMSPQLDHWFAQSKYPLLQISCHNLIPSCEICNSRVKNDTVFTLADYFHPYQENEASIEFSYRFSFLKQKYQVYLKNNSDTFILKTCKEMFVDQMYDGHVEELEDLITLEREYSKDYLNSLRDSFPNINLSDESIYRLAFGTELDKKNFHKRPMSKFKYDILKELGIID